MRFLIKDPSSEQPNEIITIINNLLFQCTNINHTDSLEETLLHYVVRNGYVYLIEDLVRMGIDVNAVSREGYTAVHTAVFYEREEALIELLKLPNIDAKMAGDHGLTPLKWVIDRKKENLVKLLSEHLKDQNMYDYACH